MGTACDDVCDNGGLKSVGMLDGEHLVAVDGRQVRPGHMLCTTHDGTAGPWIHKEFGSLLTFARIRGRGQD